MAKKRKNIKNIRAAFGSLLKDKRGVVIPITLVVMVVMLVITGAFMNVVTYETREAAKFRRKIQAFYIADGAVERAVYQVNQDPSWRSGWSNVSLGDGTYSVSVTDISSTRIKITATATVSDATRSVSRYANQIDNSVPPFNYGVFSEGSMSVSKVASYNSDTEAVPTSFSSAGSEGDIGTNSNAANAITVQTSGSPPKVKGDVTVGPGPNDPNTVISGESYISGTLSQVSSLVNLPEPAIPATYTYIANITSANSPLTAGTYLTESISLSGNDILTTTGAVKIYVRNANGISDAISISGNASAQGLGLKPANLAIYCTDAVTGVKIAGNGSLYGTIYAPKANVQLNGTGNTEFMVAGSLVGNTVSFSGSKVTLYYDVALFDNNALRVAGNGASGYSRAASWEGL